MKKTSSLTLATVVALALANTALADITGNLTLVSDYAFRGISQTWERPAIQGGFDYTHASGFYLGTWASNVSGNTYPNANMEWDFYGGYNGKINDDLSYNVGLLQYYYPGGKTSPVSPNDKFNTLEAYAGITWKWLNLKYSHTLTDYFGISNSGFQPCNFSTGVCDAPNGNSKGSGYLEANVTYEIMDKLNVIAHIGHQKVRHYKNLDYTDWKIGITKELPKEWGGLILGAAYVDTDADKDYFRFAANGETKTLSDSRFIISVGKTF